MSQRGPTVGGQALRRRLARYPDRVAFVSGSGSLTYAAALDLIGRFQAVFASKGLGRDRIRPGGESRGFLVRGRSQRGRTR